MDKPTRSSKKEQLQEEVFHSDNKKVISKVRMRSTIRIVIITFITVVMIGIIGFFLDKFLLNRAANAIYPYLYRKFSISEPNVYQGNVQFSEGVFGGQIRVQTYKMVGDVPLHWDTLHYQFSIFGSASQYFGDYSPSPQIPTTQGIRLYDPQTEQRVLQFYAPSKHYNKVINDIPLLKQIPRNDEVEMAISFHRDYTFSEVNNMLPKGVTPAWYWVNTYSTQDLKNNQWPLLTGEVYGFERIPFVNSPTIYQTPKDFIDSIKIALVSSPNWVGYRHIFDVLSHGTGKMVPNDIKIIGVVVTGRPHQLLALSGQPYVRASVLGAIANPF